MLEKYLKTKKDIKLCNDNPIFCENCIKKFRFLIEKYGFEKASVKLLGTEYQIIYKNKYLALIVVFEIGTLPYIKIIKDNKKEFLFENVISNYRGIISKNKFPNHFKLADMLNKDYKSTNDYIKLVGKMWNDNKDELIAEIKYCIEILGELIRSHIKEILTVQ